MDRDTASIVEHAPPEERGVIIAGLPAEELADLAEYLRRVKKHHEEVAHQLGGHIGEVEHALLQRLAPGEVVMAESTGRFAYNGEVSEGKATVRTDAIDEHRDVLPEDLRPVPTTKYPSVTDLRRAKKRLRQLGLSLRAFIEEPPKGRGLRWRTLSDGSEDDDG